eukprot:gene5948-676_t
MTRTPLRLLAQAMACTIFIAASFTEGAKRGAVKLNCNGNLGITPPPDRGVEIGDNWLLSKEGVIVSPQMDAFAANITSIFAEMANLKADTSSLRADLTATQSELGTTKADLGTTKAELGTANAALAAQAVSIKSLQDENVDLKSKLATVLENSGGSSSATSPGAMPECTNATSPTQLISTYNSALDSDVLRSCSRVNGEAAWRALLVSGGLVIDTADASAFSAAVNSGLPGLYVFTVGGGGEYVIDVRLTVVAGQDVRVVGTGAGGPSVTFKSSVAVQGGGMLTVSTQTKMTLAFHDTVTVQAGGALTVDGSIRVDYVHGYGLWGCTNAVYGQGKCAFSNGVTMEQYDGTIISVAGTLPGTWTATDPNNGAVVGTVARADGTTDAGTWAPPSWQKRKGSDVWESSKATPKAVTNKQSKQFILFLMPQVMTFSNDAAGYNKYAAVCAGTGLKMVISGYSNYFETQCGGSSSTTCIPLPDTDENNQEWGHGSTVPFYIHQVTGWVDFAFHDHGGKRPVNYPDGSSGWGNPKRPVCGIEL